MVGIVVVSHSQKLAEGVVELAKMMAAEAPLAAAGASRDASTRGAKPNHASRRVRVQSAAAGSGHATAKRVSGPSATATSRFHASFEGAGTSAGRAKSKAVRSMATDSGRNRRRSQEDCSLPGKPPIC